MAIATDIDPAILNTIIKKSLIRISDDKKLIQKTSNRLTSLHNEFNKINAYVTNIRNINAAKEKSSIAAQKKMTLENKNIPLSSINLTPLLDAFKMLDVSIKNLSSSIENFNTYSDDNSIDIDRHKKARPGAAGRLGKIGRVLGRGLIIGAGAYALDALAGVFGAGQDVDVEKLESIDEANWKRSSIWEKTLSAPSRVTENLAKFIGLENVATRSQQKRVLKETKDLNKKTDINLKIDATPIKEKATSARFANFMNDTISNVLKWGLFAPIAASLQGLIQETPEEENIPGQRSTHEATEKSVPFAAAKSVVPSEKAEKEKGIYKDITPEGRALLEVISQTESTGYNVIYGGSTLSQYGKDYSDHPRVFIPIKGGPNEGEKSSAAGRYQFLSSTWDDIAKRYNLKDFSPENQDRAAWYKAQERYYSETKRNLQADLQSGDAKLINSIGVALNREWTSLVGGIEQSKQYNKQTFESKFTGKLTQINSEVPKQPPTIQTIPTIPSLNVPAPTTINTKDIGRNKQTSARSTADMFFAVQKRA